jgi:hypothetical protein
MLYQLSYVRVGPRIAQVPPDLDRATRRLGTSSMRFLVAGSLLAVLLVATAGCGGSSPSASEQWAGSVCGTVDDWATQMQGYATDVQSAVMSPSADSITTIQSTITKGADATNQMVASLKSLGPAPSSSGQSATAAVNSLATQLRQTATTVQTQAEGLTGTSDPTTLATALGTMATEVSTAVSKAETTFQQLQNQSGELKDAFNNTDSCKQLQKDFG